jgi:hypothetical protein
LINALGLRFRGLPAIAGDPRIYRAFRPYRPFDRA